MRCEEFLCLLAEGKLGPDAEQHARDCRECEEARFADESLKRAYAGVRPDPERKREFVDRLAAPRPKLLRLALAAVAAGILVGLGWAVLTPPGAPPDDYAALLQKEAQGRLEKLASREKIDGELMEDLVAMETAMLEEQLAQDRKIVEVSFQEAPQALTSPDLSRRVAARRTLAKAPPESLLTINVQDVAGQRYINVLRRAAEEIPARAEGNVIVSINQNVNQRGLKFEQYQNGVVHVVATEGGQTTDVWAHDVFDLMARDPVLCQKFGIISKDGRIQIGSGIKSSMTIRTGISTVHQDFRNMERAQSELDAIRRDALASQLTQKKGDAGLADKIVQQVEQALKNAELDAESRAILDKAMSKDRKTAERYEKTMRRVRQIELLCEQLKNLDSDKR